MKKFKVLVVDDDDNLARLIQVRLEGEGYEVTRANSAPKGYLTFFAFKPDVVLTDISMGEESGLDLVRQIRQHKSAVKAIFMTGDFGRYRSEIENERKLYHASLLEKPFKGHELTGLIAKYARDSQKKAA